MSNPSYLPDDSELSVETDNSDVLEPDFETFSVSEVSPSPVEVETERSADRKEMPKPKEACEMPAFFDIFGQAVMDSIAGNLARKEVWLMDAFHESNAERYTEWRFTAEWSNKSIPGRSETVGEMLEQATYTVFDTLYKHYKAFNDRAGDNALSYEEAKETDLWDDAEYLVEYKTVYETYLGAKVEQVVGNELVRRFDEVTDVIAHSNRVSEHTDIDTPESAGIDLYLKGADITVQVKDGGGGSLPDCEADWIVRYHEPETQAPYITVQEN